MFLRIWCVNWKDSVLLTSYHFWLLRDYGIKIKVFEITFCLVQVGDKMKESEYFSGYVQEILRAH